jgi:anthranilate phosphoribosyltransferase
MPERSRGWRYAPMSMDADAPFWPTLLSKLIRGEELTPDEAGSALAEILEGRAAPSQIAGFAIALRAKGETAAEMAALVRTMLAYAERVDVAGPLLDTCGTGGDRSCSINVSTLAAFVAAGAGARVAKHGNRSATSACGSADLLETLGVTVELGPAGVARCIDEVGIGFCFAPRYHKALRHAAPVRRELGVPTTFNFLGPLANPAGVRRQTIGVGDAAMAERMVATLVELGTERALVFFGHDGLDELTTTTTSAVWEVADGEVHFSNLDPTELGIPLAVPEDLVGGDPAANARFAQAVLDGGTGPHRDIVVLNAAAALVAAGIVGDLAAGIEAAIASLDGGRAAAALDGLVKVSREAALEEAG